MKFLVFCCSICIVFSSFLVCVIVYVVVYVVWFNCFLVVLVVYCFS